MCCLPLAPDQERGCGVRRSWEAGRQRDGSSCLDATFKSTLLSFCSLLTVVVNMEHIANNSLQQDVHWRAELGDHRPYVAGLTNTPVSQHTDIK